MRVSLWSLLAILTVAVARCPIEGVAVAHPVDAPEEEFRLRWRLPVGDLADTDITSFNVQMSQDGSRTLVGYSSADTKAAMILDENGKTLFSRPVGSTYPAVSAISSDGRILVASMEGGEEEESVLAWYDVDTGQEFQNATLDKGSHVDSLSISDNADFVAASGAVWSNYTFITALDSQARQLWNQVTRAEEIAGYYEYSYLFSSLAVAGDGSHVAAALREMTVRFWGVCGGNSGVVLFNKQGELMWNYSEPECIWNVAISGDGLYVAAASNSELYGFGSEGELLWRRPFNNGAFAISDSGRRVVAGDYDGKLLLLGNKSGPYWEKEVHGQIESVAISESGDISAAIVSRTYSDAPTVHLLYVVNDEGRLLGNYSSAVPKQTTGATRVAMSGNGCCIVAALETDGIYYFERSKTETTTAILTSTSTHATSEVGNTQTAATALLVGASGLVALLFMIIAKSRVKSHDRTRKAA